MLYARKCPKCGGNIQTKIIKKAIGLGVVEIPVAQFCLNPVCDWYQDFAEAKVAGETQKDVLPIKVPTMTKKFPEIKKPAISWKHIILMAGFFIVIIVVLFVNSIAQFKTETNIQNQSEIPAMETIEETPTISVTPTKVATTISTPVITATSAFIPVDLTPKYIKIDVAHGFYPPVININRTNIVTWNNMENQRPQVILVSIDDLFDNITMEYTERYSFQFNRSGEYLFVLSEYDPFNKTYREYPNTTGKVIVK